MRAAGSWLGVLCRIKVFSITKQKKGFAQVYKNLVSLMLPIKNITAFLNYFNHTEIVRHDIPLLLEKTERNFEKGSSSLLNSCVCYFPRVC